MQASDSDGTPTERMAAMADGGSRVLGTRGGGRRGGPAAALAAERFGTPCYDRRLTDKILAAFTHAYAAGAHQTAARLKTLLAEVEATERSRHDRRAVTALRQAELWVAFVEARDAYHALQEDGAGAAALSAALERMKDAYRLWSEAV